MTNIETWDSGFWKWNAMVKSNGLKTFPKPEIKVSSSLSPSQHRSFLWSKTFLLKGFSPQRIGPIIYSIPKIWVILYFFDKAIHESIKFLFLKGFVGVYVATILLGTLFNFLLTVYASRCDLESTLFWS